MGFFDFFKKKKDDFDFLDTDQTLNNAQPNMSNVPISQQSQTTTMQSVNPSHQESFDNKTSSNSINSDQISNNVQNFPNSPNQLEMQNSMKNSLDISRTFVNQPPTLQLNNEGYNSNYQENYQSITANAIESSHRRIDNEKNNSDMALLKKDVEIILERLNTLKIMIEGLDARIRKLEYHFENENKRKYF